MTKKRIAFLFTLFCAMVSYAQTSVYTNPVLPGIADAGVIRYAGKYWLGGVSTYGDFFVSDDLVHWDRRVHIFDFENDWTRGTGAKNNQVHANDMTYSGGLFHLLFSANYWGDDRHIVHITHATSPNVDGPYKEVREDQWYENRIDPQVFIDDNGKHYLYMVKFTDGNTIWGRPLNADYTFAGDAVCQFSSQPGTWETDDNRVAEGPFVVKYRGTYYMMYNANHTSPSYGNYRLGVCEASSPLSFGPGGKYPYPVVSPQTDAIAENYTDIIVYGNGSFNPVDLDSDTIHFTYSLKPEGKLMMKIGQHGGCSVKLNGHTLNTERSDYRLVEIKPEWIQSGNNVITVSRASKDACLVALSLYDMPTETIAGDLLLTPGQPNIVRGPNAWEWWLVYMANSGWSRSQYIDRIHFTRNRLSVDGITGHNTANAFHPAPAKPVYGGTCVDSIPSDADSFVAEITFSPKGAQGGVRVGDYEIALPAEMKTDVAHVWRIEKNHSLLTAWVDGVLAADAVTVNPAGNKIQLMADVAQCDVQYIAYTPGWDEYGTRFSGWEGLENNGTGLQLAACDVLKGDAVTDYELSVMLHNATPDKGRYGVYASYTDARNYVRATVDAAGRQLVVENCVKGKVRTQIIPLKRNNIHYPDLKNTDSFEQQYRFDSDTYVSGIDLQRLAPNADPYAADLGLDHDVTRLFHEDMASRMTLSWLDGDTWRPLTYTSSVDERRADWQKLSFSPVKTRAIRFINADPNYHNRNIYRIKTTEEFASDCQLRIEKRGADIRIYADNNLMTTVSMRSASPTRIGLWSDGTANATVQNMLYYVVK